MPYAKKHHRGARRHPQVSHFHVAELAKNTGQWQLAGFYGSMHTAQSAAQQIRRGSYSPAYYEGRWQAMAKPAEEDWSVWVRYVGE